jgi:hypothetical protein
LETQEKIDHSVHSSVPMPTPATYSSITLSIPFHYQVITRRMVSGYQHDGSEIALGHSAN